jgi:sortase A
VETSEVVRPQDTRVLNDAGRPELTLVTCYPFYYVGSAPERFVVHAKRVTF